jgi:hypothetical protein
MISPKLYFRTFRSIVFVASVLSVLPNRSTFAKTDSPQEGTTFTVVVYDGTNNLPLELARVALYRGKTLLKGKVTNPQGRAVFSDIAIGRYRLLVHAVGYNDLNDSILIDETHTYDSVQLLETGGEVVVSGYRESAISTIEPTTGNQVFEAQTYHAAPTSRITQLVQENVLGAVRAPTGEVHIRGQHGELTYFVDGAPIPLGVFGGLNEVVDPKVIERSTFLTGGFPAEYGGQIAAVMDIQTRVPTGTLHADFSTYAGTYMPNGGRDTLLVPNRFVNSNGQQLSVSDHIGKLGFFLSGSRQETDRRVDPPTPSIFHDHGFDYFLYGKADYLLSDKDFLTLNLNYGVTQTEVPFDSIETGGPQNDEQNTKEAFQTLTYVRTISTVSDRESNVTLSAVAREGHLVFTPGLNDAPNFKLDSTNVVIGEDRGYTTLGLRAKYDHRFSHELLYATGLNISTTRGNENISIQHVTQSPTTIRGSDFGAFLESEIHPAEWTRFDVGVRYDQHISSNAPIETQWSPRIRWNFLLGESDDAYLYYGRLFMPVNVEGIRTFVRNADSIGTGTLAERDNFYEAVYTHSFDFGMHAKIAAFKKDSKPGLDDETIGSSAIKTPVNIEAVHTTGLELGLSYSPQESPFSAFVNTAIIHAYGSGALTGGFLPIENIGDVADLDHDQRLSIVTSFNYQPENWYLNLTGTYGSGLTNGNPNGLPYATGLFDFNQFAHTTPSWIFNLSAGYTFHVTGGATIAPSLFINNILDHEHLLKGAYFSGASWEEPRNVILRVDVHL